jgi:hypothetical protein
MDSRVMQMRTKLEGDTAEDDVRALLRLILAASGCIVE